MERGDVLPLDPADDLQHLVHPAATRGKRVPQRFHLSLIPASPIAKHQPATAEDIDGRDGLQHRKDVPLGR